MREIIFRGKRIDNGEWVEGNLFVSDTDGRAYILSGTRIVTIEWEVDPSTVGQYIDLEDKNGKQIFEGDILSLRAGRPHVVRFKNGAFILEDSAIPMSFAIKFEIIGNVHDNPELLKEEGKP